MTALGRAYGALDGADVISKFVEALKTRAIVLPRHVAADGKIHRCDAQGRGGRGDASYLLHLDGIAAGGFQNWRDGLGWEDWRADIGRELTAAERQSIRATAEAARAEREAEVATRQAEAARRAEEIWSAIKPATDQLYLTRKDIAAHGARASRGDLVLPLRDCTGTLRSLQFIKPDGGKKYLLGGQVAGCYFTIGTPSDLILVGEGFATCATVREATGYAVAVAFDCGNLPAVARAIRAKYPDAKIIVIADDDYQTVGNPGLNKGREAAAAVGGVVAVPAFGTDRPNGATDFNDLHKHAGLDAVRACFDAALGEQAHSQGDEMVAVNLAFDRSEEASWPEPDMSAARQNRRAPPVLPVEVFGPFWSGWIGDAAEGASAPVDYVAGPLLATTAMLIGNARWVSPWPAWKEPPTLWLGAVGDPSANKSPGADPVLEIVRSMENEIAAGFEATHREWATARESAKCAREAWAKEVSAAGKDGTPPPMMPANAVEPAEPMRPRILISDATAEALGNLIAAHEKGLLFFRDELAGWFNGFGRYSGSGADRAFWVEAYGGRPFTIDRVKHPLPVIIPRLSIGVLGGVQPDRLSDLIEGPDDGLQARFLWVWPDKVPPRRPTRQANFDAARAALQKLIELPLVPAEDGGSRPFLCPLPDDAADTFDQWRNEHSAIEVSGVLASAYGKAPGHLLRLALILEHLWWCAKTTVALPPSRISKAAVLSAGALVDDYFKPMAERVYGDAALPDGDRLGATLARWILQERPPVVNSRELRRRARLPGLREPEKLKLALNVLVEADWLRPAFGRAGERVGRQREDYDVNPRVYEASRG